MSLESKPYTTRLRYYNPVPQNIRAFVTLTSLFLSYLQMLGEQNMIEYFVVILKGAYLERIPSMPNVWFRINNLFQNAISSPGGQLHL